MTYEEIKQVINDCYELEDNWDGEGSYPISDIIKNKALSFISQLDQKIIDKITDIYCNSNGTLNIEWTESFYNSLQIEIGNNGYGGFKRNKEYSPTIFFEGSDLINDKQIIEILNTL